MRCVIICGAPQADVNFIRQTVQDDDFVICADKGCEYAAAAGITPALAAGDFDSCKIVPKNTEVIRLNPEKDDTDTLHCINLALEKGCSKITLLAALGGRTDHLFANLCALEYIHKKGKKGEILSKRETVRFLPKGEYSFDGFKGKTFSLFPFGCQRVCVSYEGAKYPLEQKYLDSFFPLGISNVFTGDRAKIKIYDGNAILIINLLIE